MAWPGGLSPYRLETLVNAHNAFAVRFGTQTVDPGSEPRKYPGCQRR